MCETKNIDFPIACCDMVIKIIFFKIINYKHAHKPQFNISQREQYLEGKSNIQRANNFLQEFIIWRDGYVQSKEQRRDENTRTLPHYGNMDEKQEDNATFGGYAISAMKVANQTKLKLTK